MVATKKHPKKVKLVLVQPLVYEQGPNCIFDVGRELTPDGMKYDSVFWETTRTKTHIVRRGVGIYKVKGKPDVQLYLDTGKVRTVRTATAKEYGSLPPIPLPTNECNVVPIPVADKNPKKYLRNVINRRGMESLFYHLWDAVRTNDIPVLKAAKELKLELPPYTPYAEVCARLKREAQAVKGKPRKKTAAKKKHTLA